MGACMNKACVDVVVSPTHNPVLGGRTFSPADAKGGIQIEAGKTAVLLIEYQNEFTSKGGKLYDAVKEVMEANDMLNKSVAVAHAVRKSGGKVFHVPICFAQDGSDNPNKNLGILAGCANDKLFIAGTWNAEFCDSLMPEQQDVVVAGKRGLDAFPGTDLEAQLKAHGIETVVLAGFLTNCCVESTMRTAFEKGFNVVTLTDCTATTSKEGQTAAVEGTYGMFSTPMSSADFVANLGARTPSATKAVNALEKIDSVPRAFAPAQAKGGADIQAQKTAALFIEYQNEFTSEGGKLHGAVKEVMDTTDMLKKSATVASAVRKAGGKVFHAPISFAKDATDNPNKGLGILAGCANDKLFIAGTWNTEFCDSMRPEQQDVVVVGKKGLDAFPGTDLEAQLKANGIETVVLAGFLSNCCVESTMRTAFEKGFNVVTLTDCTATTSKEGQKAAVEGTYGMFSTPMSSVDFVAKLGARTPSAPRAANALEKIDSVPRAFAPAQAKGGADIQARKTAAIFIEYQNEFTSEGGKLHGAVKEVMDTTDMLKKSVTVASAVRKAGGKVFHAPISFAKDASDNPNKGLGILAGCANDKLFIAGTWNTEFCDSMRPEQQDVVVAGKKGLDAFPGTDLEVQLKAHGIETVVLAGFLSNCCVESTMRTAFEKGFNVVTLTDCTATISKEGQKAAVEGTYGMFSTPMSSAEFMVKLEAQ